MPIIIDKYIKNEFIRDFLDFIGGRFVERKGQIVIDQWVHDDIKIVENRNNKRII